MKAPTCCTGECKQGRKCAFRGTRALTKGDWTVLAIVALLWAMAGVALLVGAK